ncbi:hypothetical protein BDV98DRAFT_565382 [Pterulicium gracile]|uniref:Actin cortical patch SUR7/pH-response regulator pali n=1 Tax=Pterulicium gracile TaxID=1884261 RepID=A0A5C3QMQ0_9AGAR|nr:hypothetical protein BDV98DRAFT_565382 [Pterula gracilis]
MIAALSKTITLYLSPIMGLTSLLLGLFAFLAPSIMLAGKVAMLTVTPSDALFPASPSSGGIDGPTLIIGPLGSCSKLNNDAPLVCLPPSFNPAYDLSVFSDELPTLPFSTPLAGTALFIAASLVLSVFFLISFTLITLRHKLPGKFGAVFEKPAVQRTSAWIGFAGFMIGLTAVLVMRMWWGKVVGDFNLGVIREGDEHKVIAQTSNAFTMFWVAYAFLGVPLVISMAKLNVQATKA